MKTTTLLQKIIQLKINEPSKMMDTSLLHKQFIYCEIKHYDEDDVLKRMSVKNIKSLILNIQQALMDDIHYQKAKKSVIQKSHTKNNIFSTISYLIDTNDVFKKIESMIREEKESLSNAIRFAVEVCDSAADQLTYSKDDPLFPVLLMDQLDYIEERLNSHARRFLFLEFSKSITREKIIVIPSFFKEMFYDFNTNIKGIIYRKRSDEYSITHYSIHFQVPIFYSNVEFIDREKIAITVNPLNVIKNPDKKTINLYRIQENPSIMEETNVLIAVRNRYRFYATISNPNDITLVTNSPWYNGIIFYPEFVIAAKGSPLSVNEWEKHIDHLNRYCNGKMIVFRLPAFDSCITTEDFNGKYPTLESLYDNQHYYENYLRAIAKIMISSSARITIHVPRIIESTDIVHWEHHIDCMLKEYGYIKEFDKGYEFAFRETIHNYKPFQNSYHCIYNIDYLATDFIIDFHLYYHHLSLQRYKASHINADVTFNHYFIRKHGQNHEQIIMGYTITNEKIFNQLYNSGCKCFGIHPKFILSLLPTLSEAIQREGMFVGLFAKNLKRQLFYENLRKELGPSAHIKPGTYQKMLQELENIKEEKK